MGSVKKVWITENEHLTTLSLESENAVEPHRRIIFHESVHPDNPTPEHPLRHVLMINCLTDDDLCKIYLKIGEYLRC